VANRTDEYQSEWFQISRVKDDTSDGGYIEAIEELIYDHRFISGPLNLCTLGNAVLLSVAVTSIEPYYMMTVIDIGSWLEI